jgi:hypothetical protein
MWARMVVWVAIIAWCAFVLARPEVGDELGRTSLDMMGLSPAPPADWTPHPLPPGVAPPPATDDGAAAALAGRFGATCPMPGQRIRVTLGPSGLVAVESFGAAPPCAAAAVWGAPWPTMPGTVVMEVTATAG